MDLVTLNTVERRKRRELNNAGEMTRGESTRQSKRRRVKDAKTQPLARNRKINQVEDRFRSDAITGLSRGRYRLGGIRKHHNEVELGNKSEREKTGKCNIQSRCRKSDRATALSLDSCGKLVCGHVL